VPGRNAAQAREAFPGPLRTGLSCITNAQLFAANKAAGEVEALTLSEDPLRLRCGDMAAIAHVSLRIGHRYRLVQDGDGWHVSTVAYEYYLFDDDEHELVAWHWHPEPRVRFPHVHAPADPVHRRMHIPSGRISIESVLRMLITDFGVEPRPDHVAGWEAILDEAERNFVAHRRWH
jgi:hypothetical protein